MGLHDARYVYLLPSRSGTDNLADVYCYITSSQDLEDAEVAARLHVHQRTTARVIAHRPVTGPAVAFQPTAFTAWFTDPQTRHTLPGLVTTRYESSDRDDSAAFRVQALLDRPLPEHIWRVDPAVSAITLWPTIDPQDECADDGGGVLTFRYGPLELSTGHLAAADLVPEPYLSQTGTVAATAHDAAVQALAAVAARINAAVAACSTLFGDAALLSSAAAPDQHPASCDEHDPAAGVAVSLVTGWDHVTVHVDPDLPDATVTVTIGDPHRDGTDVVGIDLEAGTIGVWSSSDPDNREWTVVHHLTPDQLRPAQPGQ
ncbi:hypothetical protein GCM10010399_83990 [Dactylosporangium fulvum]|uniref:Uncharacterized protein n=1 Tax=Dactylosporangium fulvum TaxID=53359 RepID=A0ABY5VTQ2_9ACTN|nr:hypothetical protein [Dactylosporangium fulvum]UWP80529.1 hypothetical protein Dfulv_35970 [Dactylosporangium fulvum]